jgi:chitinase
MGNAWEEQADATPEWSVGVNYKRGDIVTYQGQLYECRQAHRSITGWQPPNVLALWLPI